MYINAPFRSQCKLVMMVYTSNFSIQKQRHEDLKLDAISLGYIVRLSEKSLCRNLFPISAAPLILEVRES
jgi:hypothetical protein